METVCSSKWERCEVGSLAGLGEEGYEMFQVKNLVFAHCQIN